MNTEYSRIQRMVSDHHDLETGRRYVHQRKFERVIRRESVRNGSPEVDSRLLVRSRRWSISAWQQGVYGVVTPTKSACESSDHW